MKKKEIQQLYVLLDKFAGQGGCNNLNAVKEVKDLVARELSLEKRERYFLVSLQSMFI